MKYLFYIILIMFAYRVFFRPKVIIEHRHYGDKKPNKGNKNSSFDAELTEYEEVK